MMPCSYSAIPGIEKNKIDTPALLIDLDSMDFNIDTMAGFFLTTQSKLRPHFKTHKTPVIAHMQLQAGAIGMTCAKVGEAEVLVNAGIRDILIANQVVGPEKIARLASLARQARMTVAVDNEENIRELSAGSQNYGSLIHVVIEIDVGLGRCGVSPGERAVELARFISGIPGLAFVGLLGYEGQAVFINDLHSRREAVNQAMQKLITTADLLRQSGFAVEIISAGGTGTYDLTGNYPGITEVEAGSYVLMDTCYRQLGLPFRCALKLLATVISTPARERAIIDTGLKALTSDHGLPEVCSPAGARLVNLNEEHGILAVDTDQLELKVGEKVEIIPSHVCTTVNLHEVFYAIRGHRLVATWPISGRGKFT
jgi:D-serine deaminase-like pyridoxal phosphate-dependent protein